MKTERELFEEAIVEKCGFNPRTSFELSDVTGEYKSDVTYFAWIMWQASANREGYKLVPVEPNYKQLDALKNSCELFKKAGVSDLEAHGAYKAMIGAQENNG